MRPERTQDVVTVIHARPEPAKFSFEDLRLEHRLVFGVHWWQRLERDRMSTSAEALIVPVRKPIEE